MTLSTPTNIEHNQIESTKEYKVKFCILRIVLDATFSFREGAWTPAMTDTKRRVLNRMTLNA